LIWSGEATAAGRSTDPLSDLMAATPMSRLSKDRWEAVSPHLDRALEMGPEERRTWIAALRVDDPALASALDTLLKEGNAVDQEGFLQGLPPRPPMAAAAGEAMGAYTLVSVIGSGGMGQVWLARRSDGHFAGEAAVKILNADVGDEHFKREANILARLTHPHIAHLIDAGVSPEGQPYLVLEHVDGERIDGYCDKRRLGVQARLRLFLEVLAAVAHAHANLIVHRDIKPSNILVSTDGHVKLLDFGIAKLLEAEGGGVPALTLESGRALTPEYAAPEQVTAGAITTATDVYALGLILYVLLTGRHPVDASRGSAAELVKAIVEMDPPRPSVAARVTTRPSEALAYDAARRGTTPDRLHRILSGDLDTIVAKALKKRPEERYPSVTALADDVRRFLAHQPISARPDRIGYRAVKFARRNRLSVSLGSFVLLALLAGLAGTAWQARVAARERDLSLAQLERAESTNAFTSFLLGQAPGGRPVPVQEILARAERLVDKRFAADEPLAVDLLVTIASIYDTRNETDGARRTMKRAHEMSQRVADAAVRAKASCGWARAFSAEGDFAGAYRLIDKALAETTDEARFDSVVANCLLERGIVAMTEVNAADAADAGDRALRRLDRRPGAFPEIRADVLQLLAVSRRLQGDTRGANRRFAEALEQVQRIGRGETMDASILLNNWAGNMAMTNSLQALVTYGRAITILQGESPDSAPSAARINYGVQLNRLARYAEARSTFEGARADARKHGNVHLVGKTSYQIARACRKSGDLACAERALREADAALRTSLPQGHQMLAMLCREQGLLATAKGDEVAARALLAEALAIHEKVAAKQVEHIETLLDVAGWELKVGRSAEAEAHARAALAQAEALRAGMPVSAWVGLSQLLLGEVSRGRGDGPAARRFFEDALSQMTPTLGNDHPAVRQAKARLAEAP
jgi:eukaryotic-like serine/threonine-protein kinase